MVNPSERLTVWSRAVGRVCTSDGPTCRPPDGKKYLHRRKGQGGGGGGEVMTATKRAHFWQCIKYLAKPIVRKCLSRVLIPANLISGCGLQANFLSMVGFYESTYQRGSNDGISPG